ncbi:MAG: sulfur carrier protein ThiS [Candidatus Marinamargulisbacteria bacterium]|jgi:thiamine biosynthesis protein ThiS
MGSITVILNGTATITNAHTVVDLITSLSFDPLHVIVEHNGQVLQNDQYHQALQADDRIEIIRYIGGGTTASSL